MRTFLSVRRRRSSGELSYADPPDGASPDPTVHADLRLGLEAALAGLGPVDRAVLVLRYLDDLGVHEVATRLDVSAGAVRNRSMRALARLRPLLDPTLLKELP